MIKAASTTSIIQLLQGYEEAYGPGVITSIGSIYSGSRTTEYVINVKDDTGEEHRIEVPSIDEEKFWAWQHRELEPCEVIIPDAIIYN
jgi:hypothetical protein